MQQLKISLPILFILNTLLMAQNYGEWTFTDSLNIARANHSSILLDNGNILVVGGSGKTQTLNRFCEIYDRTTMQWELTPQMNYGRTNPSLAKLPDGRILVIGGYRETSCEIYDPVLETWELTDSLSVIRASRWTTSVMKNGKILLTGGNINFSSPREILGNCEIYDPIIEQWHPTSNLTIARDGHTASLRHDGKVMIVGGSGIDGILDVCEIFDPATETWTLLPSKLNAARVGHSSITLENGNILITGGAGYNSSWILSCELFDVNNQNWSWSGNLSVARADHFIGNVSENLLFIFGGAISSDSWEIYDLETFTSIYLGEMLNVKLQGSTVQLSNNEILNIGGLESSDNFNWSLTYRCELFSMLPTRIEFEETQELTQLQVSAYPNPFNSTTMISYVLNSNDYVSMNIYNLIGELVADVFTNKNHVKGTYNFEINFSKQSTGIYILQIFTRNSTNSIKLIYLK